MQTAQSIHTELVGLEKQYWNAIKTGDTATAVSLSNDPCVVVGAKGVGELDNASLAQVMKGADYELKNFTLDDIRVRQVTDDVAVIATRSRKTWS